MFFRAQFQTQNCFETTPTVWMPKLLTPSPPPGKFSKNTLAMKQVSLAQVMVTKLRWKGFILSTKSNQIFYHYQTGSLQQNLANITIFILLNIYT